MVPVMSDNWKLTLPCTRQEAEALYEADELLATMNPIPSIVTQELEAFNDARWELLAYFNAKPSQQVITQIQALIPSAAKANARLDRLQEVDWLTLSQQGLQPVRAGRFYVHTSQNAGLVPPGAVTLQIEASQAFGTGGHETTSGCLSMLDQLRRRGHRFEFVADIGTGTGLLAFAAHRLWPRAYITASDIDPISIEVTIDNASVNDVPLGQSLGQVALCVATGTDHEMIQRRAPYDLVIANILAGPLIELAPSLTDILEEGGTLILAGLLKTQANAVIRTYCRLGFRLAEISDLGDWPCLRLVKRHKYSWRRPIRSDGRTSQPPGDFGTW